MPEPRRRIGELEETIEQLRGEVTWLTQELIARDRGAAVNDGAPAEWRPMLHAIRRLVHAHVPADRSVVVVSSGVDALLRYAGPRADHLSQDRGGSYAGSHPSCGLAAIAQVEAARWRGADFLLIPHSELWWFDHYPELAKHLEQRYARLADDETAGILWNLQAPGPLREVHELLGGLSGHLDHRPTLLDWHTGCDLASSFDEYKVFSPLGDAATLSYLDGTIDVVAVGTAEPGRIAEARRVASSVVVRVAPEPEVVWRDAGDGNGWGDVSILVVGSGGTPPAPQYVDRLRDSLPGDFAGEILIDGAPERERRPDRLRRLADEASGEIVVALDGATWPTPGWLRPLVSSLKTGGDVAFVTGMVLAPDGRLLAAGAAVHPDRDERPDAARHQFACRIERPMGRFFATRRELLLGTSARDDGVLYEPEAVAIAAWSRERRDDG
jgi:hypothetical protein